MRGRHASPGRKGFWRELVIFGLKVLFWGLVVIGVVWVLQQIPPLGAGEEEAVSPTPPGDELAVASGGAVTTAEPATTAVPATTTTIALPLDPSEVLVLVLNSTERSGMAARLTEKIAALGYQTLQADNYPTPLGDSVLWHRDGFADEAEELARVLPVMIVEPNPEPNPVADLVIVLGESFEE